MVFEKCQSVTLSDKNPSLHGFKRLKCLVLSLGINLDKSIKIKFQKNGNKI
tara:strand:+ start:1368 stop:1520 length:153 start_codon:yes stop_codon:yes gene_type:complete